MRKIVLSIAPVSIVNVGNAATMAKGKIIKLVNTTNAAGAFSIWVEGDGGFPCNNNLHTISCTNFWMIKVLIARFLSR